MKTEANVTDKTIRSEGILGPFGKLHIMYACCAFLGLIVSVFLCRPLLIKLRDTANRLHEVETEVLNQRSAIAVSKKSDVKDQLIRRNEIPLAIAKLTEEGRVLGLSFSSISPMQLQETTQTGVWKLPISFTIESEFKDIGRFLAYVEGFSRTIAEVESLSIRPREDNPPKARMDLVLNLYGET